MLLEKAYLQKGPFNTNEHPTTYGILCHQIIPFTTCYHQKKSNNPHQQPLYIINLSHDWLGFVKTFSTFTIQQLPNEEEQHQAIQSQSRCKTWSSAWNSSRNTKVGGILGSTMKISEGSTCHTCFKIRCINACTSLTCYLSLFCCSVSPPRSTTHPFRRFKQRKSVSTVYGRNNLMEV